MKQRPRGLFGLVLCVVLAALMVDGACAGESRQNAKSKPEGQVLRPWLMVSLTPGGTSGGGRHVFSVIKRLSGNPNGEFLHFSEVTPELVAEKRFEFIVLSPQGTPWCRYTGERGIALQNFLWTLPLIAEEMNIPILGICGGHQALALAFGGKVGPIRAGEDDCMPYSKDRQSGTLPIKIETGDPLFDGVAAPLRIVESHYDEVKVLPREFVLLASEQGSRIQIMRHAHKPVYGIQGHPEHFSDSRPDGGVLLRNFLKIAARHNKEVRQDRIAAAPEGN